MYFNGFANGGFLVTIDVVAEGTLLGNHTFAVQKGINLGVVLFIVSIDPLNPFEVPLLNTILLLSSGASITYAHHSLIEGNRRGTILGIIITVLFAIVFTGLQGYEYYNAPFTLSDSVYGSTFFFATGFHGLHVIIGTLFIAVAFFRILSYHLTDHHHLGFEGSILY
ncbi:BZ3500_MvSof-1268-A1-R1_C042g00104 [Microbotryum saponariae]|uniref:Cytochrome c oxidase subunit 3 n=1 Tax=Microbotryum saponariae TaxID=289078 RepID=A0A2X0MSB9_9BASI|nr:BZ3500_MvSof-1268-A1-R1_C042g00104 [Microbotryum saponariae]